MPMTAEGARQSFPLARMAKLADAADLKSADRKVVGVQVPLRAPTKQKIYIKQGHLSKVAILVSVANLVAKWYSAWHRRVRHAQKAEGKETPGRF